MPFLIKAEYDPSEVAKTKELNIKLISHIDTAMKELEAAVQSINELNTNVNTNITQGSEPHLEAYQSQKVAAGGKMVSLFDFMQKKIGGLKTYIVSLQNTSEAFGKATPNLQKFLNTKKVVQEPVAPVAPATPAEQLELPGIETPKQESLPLDIPRPTDGAGI